MKKIIFLAISLFALTSCKISIHPPKEPTIPTISISESYGDNELVGEVGTAQYAIQTAVNISMEYKGTGLLDNAFVATSGSGVIVAHNESINTYYLVSNISTFTMGNLKYFTDAKYVATLYNGRRYVINLHARYEKNDLSVFSLKTNDKLAVASVGDSDSLEVGDAVYAIGTPRVEQTLINSLMKGVVSGMQRQYNVNLYDGATTQFNAFQFDAPINSGMEGGAVYDKKFKLVGIITYSHTGNTDYESLSMAIPYKDVENVVNSLIRDKAFNKKTLGLAVVYLNSIQGNQIDWLTNKGIYNGVYIDKVDYNSLAYKSGMKHDEFVLGVSMDNSLYTQPMNNIAFGSYINRLRTGDNLYIKTLDKFNREKVYTVRV